MNYEYVRSVGTLENIPIILPHVPPHGTSVSKLEFQHLIAAWMQNTSFLLTYIFWHFHCASHEMEGSHSEVTVFTVTLETHTYTHTSLYTLICIFSPPSWIPSVGARPQHPPHMLVVQNEMVIMEIRA